MYSGINASSSYTYRVKKAHIETYPMLNPALPLLVIHRGRVPVFSAMMRNSLHGFDAEVTPQDFPLQCAIEYQ